MATPSTLPTRVRPGTELHRVRTSVIALTVLTLLGVGLGGLVGVMLVRLVGVLLALATGGATP